MSVQSAGPKRGVRRIGESVDYGAVADAVRATLAREGLVSAPAVAEATGMPLNGIHGALKREAHAGRAVRLTTGVYVSLGLAVKISALLEEYRRTHRG